MQKGLSEIEAKRLLAEYGENKIKSKHKNSVMGLFIGQFKDALIIILLVSTLISLAMGEYVEAITISAIVVINALLGFIQEFKTEKTLERLGNLAAPRTKVVRDGTVRDIDATLIVPGDIVKISAGDRIPADGKITDAACLTVDESMLSGESVGIDKNPGDMIYMGTTVSKGNATLCVTQTGDKTEMGKIAGLIDGIEISPTPLQKRLAQLSKYIGIGALIICAVVSAVGILRGEDIFDMFLTGISLAVAAVPEGLPAIVTIALALSINRMVKCRALIRKLHAVEKEVENIGMLQTESVSKAKMVAASSEDTVEHGKQVLQMIKQMQQLVENTLEQANKIVEESGVQKEVAGEVEESFHQVNRVSGSLLEISKQG